MATLKHLYEITKPGIIYGNAIPFIGGFFLAARGTVGWRLFIAALVGMSLVIASGCVFNNVIDRDVDAKMRRTKDRALASGKLSGPMPIIYGTVLGLLGFMILAVAVNLAATAVAAFGFLFYVVMYSLWWKRRSAWGTVVGSFSGAVPPVIGYAAVSGRIDLAAFCLFAIMVAWQMPHFYAIAIRRADEYAAAGIPVLPVVRGVRATKRQMLWYIVAFIAIAPLLTVFGYCNVAYAVVSLVLGLGWLGLGISGLRLSDKDERNIVWAKRMFLASLVVLVLLFGMIAVSAV